jgi:hypothetical protein
VRLNVGIIADLTAVADSLFGVRDAIGAAKSSVYIATQTWSGSEIGAGTMVETTAQVVPSPGIEDLAHNQQVVVGGDYKSGDLLLKHISKQSYTTESAVDCTTALANVQKYYKIDGALYSVVRVESDYISWHVHIRRVSHS